MTRTNCLEILLVEDNPGDVRLTMEAFKRTEVPAVFHTARDGEEGLAFLRREEPFTEARRPDLVLLDLNLPRKDGRELLADIKTDPNLRTIPIVVLTTSNASQDILKAYDLHANCYIIKPVGLDKFVTAITAIEKFWLNVATLPSIHS